MLIVTIKDDSDELWSLKGWKLLYKRLDETTYGWYLVDPRGSEHKCLYNPQGINMQYNVSSIEDLVKSVESSSFTKDAIRKYVANTVCFQSLTF